MVRRRGFATAAVLVIAVLSALLVGFSPSLAPAGLHPRGLAIGAARAQILIDTSSSELTDVGQATVYNTELAGRLAREYVTYLQGDSATAALGQAVGLRGENVSASGPFTLLLGRVNFASQAPAPPDPRRVNHAYRLLLDIDGRNPILNIYAQAPTTGAAITLVDTARTLLLRVVAGQQARNPVPTSTAVVLRPLGATVGGSIGTSARWQLMAFVFALVLAIGGSLLYARRLRRTRAHGDAPAGRTLDRLDEEPPRSDDWPHTKRPLPWALAGFLTMLFLVPFDAIKLPVHLPLDSTLDRPTLVALVLLWLSSFAVLSGTARPRVKLTRVHLAALAFFALCCVGLAANGNALASMDETTLVVKKLALLISFIVFFFVVASVMRPREVPRYAALIVVLGVIVAIGTVIEYRYKYNPFYALWGKLLPVSAPSTLDARDAIGRLTVFGPTSQPLELAALLAMVLPFALVGSISARVRRDRVLYTIAVALLLAGGLATSRKTSLIAPAGAILLLLAYRPRAFGGALLRLALVLGVLIHFTSPGALGNVLSQFEPGHFGSALTTTDRTARYDAVVPDVINHMLIGRGFQSYDPHKYRILDNQYLDLLITVGLIGLLAYIAIFGAMMSAAHRTIRGPDPRRASLALAALSSVGVIVIASALFDVLSFPHVPYLLFFIAAMIIVLRERSPAPQPARVASEQSQPDGHSPPPLPPSPPSVGRPREPVLSR